MKHKQTGYQSAWTPHQPTFMAILHGTAVLTLVKHSLESSIYLNTGGWHTRATANAMRGALKELGLDVRIEVRLKNSCIQVRDTSGESLYDTEWKEINDRIILNL